MFNPKISGIAACIGFVLSLLLGLISGAHFPLLLIRACIFAAVFFALASAGYGAIQMYLPELLAKKSRDIPSLGAQVDISIGGDGGDSGEISLAGFGDDAHDFLENPGNSGGDTLDHAGEAVYTEEGAADEFPGNPVSALPGDLDFASGGGTGAGADAIPENSAPALPGDSGFFSGAGEADSVDMLPDLDAMSGAFSESLPVGGEGAGGGSPASSLNGLGGFGGQAKKTGLDDEFNVKEMASAIQTILKRENKG